MAGSARVSLLCLPCAGASATMYLRWRHQLPRWIELVPVELPGRGMRMGERFVETYDAQVARICALIASSHEASFNSVGKIGILRSHSTSPGAMRAYSTSPPTGLTTAGNPASRHCTATI